MITYNYYQIDYTKFFRLKICTELSFELFYKSSSTLYMIDLHSILSFANNCLCKLFSINSRDQLHPWMFRL